MLFIGPLAKNEILTNRTVLAAALRIIVIILLAFVSGTGVLYAQDGHEGKRIADLTVAFEDGDVNASVAEQFRNIAREAVGVSYSAVRIRDAIEQLYATKRIVSVVVEAEDQGADATGLRFLIKRKTQALSVKLEIADAESGGAAVTEQELLFRLTLLDPGSVVTDQTLRENATLIQDYLRDRGYFKADVTFEQKATANANEVAVTFRVLLNAPAAIGKFDVQVEGIDKAIFAEKMLLRPGETFSRDKLNKDEEKIREILRSEGYLAPTLSPARPVYDSEANTIDITVIGEKGPIVEVKVDSERDRPGIGTQKRLLPIKREGTLDFSAIVEGERRLEAHFQELGYFFANVTPYCSVEPPLAAAGNDAALPANDTESLCSVLNNQELTDKQVTVTYRVDLSRQLKLTDIRLKGTQEFTIADIKPVLESHEANILGIIPLFGYGRGYTSERLLEEDTNTITSLLRELGYRDASVRVNQGVSPDGENLVITFVVDQGPATIISEVSVTGSSAFSEAELLRQLPDLVGKNFSRAQLRNGQRRLGEFLAQAGYFDSVVDLSTEDRGQDPASGIRRSKVIFQIKHRVNPLSADLATSPGQRRTATGEGKKVYIGRVLVTGNEKTKTEAIQRAVTLEPNALLRSTDIYTSEQNLYSSDVFSRVEIKEQPVRETPDGRVTDVIIGVEEQPQRILSYGGGYSTEYGASGFVDIRHQNLFGSLWQGGARLRLSQRQQLAQIDFFNPRFLREGSGRFAPLTITAQYQRDSTVTRFFRSEFDKGTFGIVQRLDENGQPVDEFGAETGSPTLHRLTFTAETNRTISRSDRSILFVRYRFEDVRLYNIRSLLIKDLLLPDSRVRISGFGATFVRDTRKNCNVKYTILDIIARGEPGDACRYSASDPTTGSYLTAEFNTSLPFLGANIGFNKFQASYNVYYSPKLIKSTKLAETTFAARAVLGLAGVFSEGNRFPNNPELKGILPISERFFAGGSTTLRGFSFESAGPRIVVVPQGVFHNSSGEPVFLDPFAIPIGGNALAVVNLEARIPMTEWLRVVPFYDGGNVFRRMKDIFNPADVVPGDVAQSNLRVLWSNTIGLGLRLKTPVGGEFAIDYGHLLNPPNFLIPQMNGPNAIYRPKQDQIHFRFSQAF